MHPTIARILDLAAEIATREGDEPPGGRPGPPATPDAIVEAHRRHQGKLSSAYLGFLGRHDGWPETPFGMRLFGTAELGGEEYDRAVETFGYSQEAAELPAELTEAVIIGENEDGSDLLLLLAGGEVVDFLYEEVERFADLDAYLADRLTEVRAHLDLLTAQQARAVRETDPEVRATVERDLLAALRAETVPASIPPPATPPGAEPRPAEVTLGDLVVPGEDTDDDEAAAVQLNLVLYLGAYPSPGELVGAFRAFRRRFPVDGRQEWWLPARYYSPCGDSDDPDDEEWAEHVRADTDGMYGIRLRIGGRYVLNVCGVPPAADGAPRASFCEVMVPPAEDPAKVAALAVELAELLPVRSGHGGWSAYVQDAHDDAAYDTVFGWCRRFLGLDVGYLDGWLTGAHRRVVGAGWLTVLGPTFAAVLADPPAFGCPETTVTRTSAGGLVIRAGAAPVLGDVARGEFPAAQAEVERYVAPLKLGGWQHTARVMMSGHAFSLAADELPGGFREHRATARWLRRLVDPAAFLGPSVRERGEELLAQLHAEHPGDQLDHWHATRSDANLADLFHLLVGATAVPHSTYAARDALELVVAHPEDAPLAAYNNLLTVYLRLSEVDHAVEFLGTALEHAPANPRIFHTAACVAAQAGDHERALELLVAAQEHNIPGLAALRSEESFRPLHADPRFLAATAD